MFEVKISFSELSAQNNQNTPAAFYTGKRCRLSPDLFQGVWNDVFKWAMIIGQAREVPGSFSENYHFAPRIVYSEPNSIISET